MANGNVKLSVSGVDQFKRGMKDAQTSVKTLDAELKKNEQQFRLTGDAEVYMEQKTEILKRQIEQQKTVVDQAERALAAMKNNGVDPTSQAFQQMQQNLLRAQGALMGMEADLNNVGSAGQNAAGDVGNLKSQLQNIGSQISFKTLTDGLEKITSKLKSAASAAWDLGAAIVNATLGAGEWADELQTTASQYGISPDELQRRLKTARLIDTEVSTIMAARTKLETGLGKNDATVMGAFEAFGLDPADYATIEDKFWAIGDAIYHMSDAEEQEVYAQKVFGRSWHDLIPLFEAGREKYEEMNAGWNVVSDKDLENLGKMDDQYQKLASEWETFKMTMLATLSGPLTTVMEHLTDIMGKLNEYLQSEEGQDKLNQITSGLTTFFDHLLEVKPEDIIDAFSKALDTVKGALEWIYAHWQDIVNGIKAIALAFAGIQLASLAANLLSITTSLGFFGGGGGGGAAVAGGKTAMSTIGKNFLPIGTSVLMLYPLYEKIADGTITWQKFLESNPFTTENFGKLAGSIGDLFTGNTPIFSEENKDISRKAAGRLVNSLKTGSPLENWLFGYRDPNGNLYDPNAKPISTEGWSYGAEDFMRYQAQNDRVLELLESGAGQKNSLTSDDIGVFRGLPAAIEAAARRGIESANIQVVIQDDAMGDITNKTNQGLWQMMGGMLN